MFQLCNIKCVSSFSYGTSTSTVQVVNSYMLVL